MVMPTIVNRWARRWCSVYWDFKAENRLELMIAFRDDCKALVDSLSSEGYKVDPKILWWAGRTRRAVNNIKAH